ncbi:MAG TPA: YpdA family putative bacillithiol disulfide reductase [Longimicrobiales bacterium]
MQESVELAVIGGGPSGLSVGVAARRHGLGCVIFEKGCLTRCIAGYPVYGHFFSTADKLELGGLPFIITDDKPTRRDALKYYRRVVEHFALDVRQYEEVVDVRPADDGFTVVTRRIDGSQESYSARRVVVATGYWDTPNLLGIPGEDLPKVTHYYREALPFFGQDCLVIGGGNSAVEAALDLYRSGARVTMVHFADRLDSGVKPWVLPDINGRIQKGEIAVHWRTRVIEIRPRTVRLRSEADGRTEEIKNDFVFAMTGYTPDPWLLRELGVGFDPETGIPNHDPETMETDVPGVFIAGVVAGGNRPNKIFIENAREHGPRIVAAIRAAAAAPSAPAGSSVPTAR